MKIIVHSEKEGHTWDIPIENILKVLDKEELEGAIEKIIKDYLSTH